MARMRISEILTQEEIKQVKEFCLLFNAQYCEINGVIYQAPERIENQCDH